MIITGCEERRSLTKQPVKAEPKHPAIEGKRTLKVRDLQMDVPDADAWVDRLAVGHNGC